MIDYTVCTYFTDPKIEDMATLNVFMRCTYTKRKHTCPHESQDNPSDVTLIRAYGCFCLP